MANDTYNASGQPPAVPEQAPSATPNDGDVIHAVRVLEYTGPRDAVLATLAKSIQSAKVVGGIHIEVLDYRISYSPEPIGDGWQPRCTRCDAPLPRAHVYMPDEAHPALHVGDVFSFQHGPDPSNIYAFGVQAVSHGRATATQLLSREAWNELILPRLAEYTARCQKRIATARRPRTDASHWPDCALNHGGTECDMGPECGSAEGGTCG